MDNNLIFHFFVNDQVENAGSVPYVEGTSALQLPQVPLLDATPTMNNNNINLEPDGSLKALNNRNQAEQLKDTDAPSDPMHKNTKELQQQMDLSALSEKIRPDKGHDSFGMNESKRSGEEPTIKKEQENKSWSSLDINATSIVLALPAVTGKESVTKPDVLAPSSTKSPCKRGQRKKNQTDLTVQKRYEGTRSAQRKLKEKDSKKLHTIKDYGKELVGAKVKVWWPRDRRFYEGVISSFNPKMEKHKVIYTDDDVEILNLRCERWELLDRFQSKKGL
ncbi:PREDICTED: DNA mismatch repair protein MSH6-like [Ipomoea nil]|uniref:DNA mismatch repair protein MSH6-like n=1 Tax=Ipomoea nil TaxID=35883 RepID=UPI000900ECF8|nr:PREDICTED: DNA mismatch repair protein MSH6-like [Ipomoea nil]